MDLPAQRGQEEGRESSQSRENGVAICKVREGAESVRKVGVHRGPGEKLEEPSGSSGPRTQDEVDLTT